ncbi:MAG: putative lipid II flippase FtsW [Parcubacteria group bacterium CG1_02_58_44]|nr:MAG: putative lipid II flippase FtsW [Parcubacteria group bacterium CG1_02_58_44]
MADNRIDRKFFVFLGLLLLLGMVMLISASGPIAYQKFGDPYWYVRHQLFYGLLPGVVLFFLMSHVDYRALRRLARPFFYFSVLLLLLVFVPGIGADWGTSHSWINLAGFSFQPAELVKLSLLLFLADRFGDLDPDDLRDPHLGLMPFMLSLGLVSVLIVLQPDLGSLIAIASLAGLTFMLAGAPWSHLAGLASSGVLALWILIKIKPYRANRLMSFLHPELDPQGIGYHINQAYLAIGSGGLLGLGLGHSRQKYMYLPEVIGDSIFAVMAEELGFVVMTAVIILLVLFLLRLIVLARRAPDRFGRLLVGGISCWVFAQVMLNVGSMIGLFPMTGLPLPFMSYGGTALIVMLASMGIVANVSRQVEDRPRRGTKSQLRT